MPITPESYTQILDASKAVVNWPQTSGNGNESTKTPLFNPNILAPGYLFYATGAFDDIANDKRGKGDFVEIEQVDAGQGTLEGQFLEHIYIHGGAFGCHNEGKGDWVEMMAYAPASTPEDRTGTHDGNANKVPTGLGFNIIVPAPGNDGDWNVDGSTLTKGEINAGLVPVPNQNDPQTGYWNWDPGADPSITPAAGDGVYDLYDVAMPLVRQANRIGCLLHEKDCCPDELKGKKLLPHWKIRFTVNRGTSGTLLVQFVLKTSRKSTVNADDLA